MILDLILAICLSAGSTKEGNVKPSGVPDSVPVEAVIPAEDLPDVRKKAAQGNTERALLLWRYYGMVENDISESAFWLRVAAEQGNCFGMREYAALQGSGLGNTLEATEWDERAQERGCKPRRTEF